MNFNIMKRPMAILGLLIFVVGFLIVPAVHELDIHHCDSSGEDGHSYLGHHTYLMVSLPSSSDRTMVSTYGGPVRGQCVFDAGLVRSLMARLRAWVPRTFAVSLIVGRSWWTLIRRSLVRTLSASCAIGLYVAPPVSIPR